MDNDTLIYWQCSCGEQFLDARRAFLHRDGSWHHHVTPMPMERVVVPEPSEEEIRRAVRACWQPMELEAIRAMLHRGEGWVEAQVYEDEHQ